MCFQYPLFYLFGKERKARGIYDVSITGNTKKDAPYHIQIGGKIKRDSKSSNQKI
jgi:hypothetical protein